MGGAGVARRTWILIAVAAGLVVAVVAAVIVGTGAARTSHTAAEASPTPAPAASPGAADTAPVPQESASAGPSAAPDEGQPQDPQSPVPTTIAPGIVEYNALPPVGFDAPVSVPGAGVEAKVARVEAIDGIGNGIGEISGPSLAFTVAIANNSSGDFATGSVIVNCYDSADAPCIPLLSDERATTLPATIKPGESAEAVYIFVVPADQRSSATLGVSLGAEAATVVFRGAIPGVS